MSEKNKVKFGLKNAHYAVVQSNESYGLYKPLPGSVNLTLSPKGDKTEFYADDIVYFETTANQGYEGSLELALIPDDFEIDVMGNTVDGNGAIIENSNAIPNNIALAFEFAGDKKAVRHVLYNVSVARPEVTGATKQSSIDPQTETLTIGASPLGNGVVKAKLGQGMDGYDTFFDNVYIPDQVENTTDGPASVDLGALDNVVITVTSPATPNGIRSVKARDKTLDGAHYFATGLALTLKATYLEALEPGEYDVKIILEKGSVATTTLTVIGA